MILNHLDLQVTDVQATASFFETFFGLTVETNRRSPTIAFLSDSSGFVLVLQKKERPDQVYPEGFHVGFLVDDVATVEQTHQQLLAHGIDVSPIERNNRGTMIYCRHTDGILVEVSCRKKH